MRREVYIIRRNTSSFFLFRKSSPELLCPPQVASFRLPAQLRVASLSLSLSLVLYPGLNEALESKDVTNRPRVLGNRTSEALERSRNERKVISSGGSTGDQFDSDETYDEYVSQQQNHQIEDDDDDDDANFVAVV